MDELFRWVSNFNSKPLVHVVHGESDSKQAFRDRLVNELGVRADIPDPGQVVEI
jgi:Cft2 family RNA processing exonuclease